MFKEYQSSVHPASQLQASLGIFPVWLGHLTAQENYECKPRVLDDFFIISVASGEGQFQCKGKEYSLKPQDAYFLFPGTVHYYRTHPRNLLDLWWVGFNGPNGGHLMKEIGITPDNPIIKKITDNRLFSVIREMVDLPGVNYASDLLQASGNLYKMLGILMEICSPRVTKLLDISKPYSRSVMRALNFMNANYPQPISMQQTAAHAGLSRAHFAVAFKQEVGCSPSEYLAGLRLQNARRYLADPNLSIMQVAHSVGFQDALYFSRFFRKAEKVSPREYRERLDSLE